MNIVMEKTNKKLNDLQAQVIVLEAQLQCAVDLNQVLQQQVEKTKKKESKSEY